ncbi:MAG: S1 RNA-binding domain-containing protein [Parasporobacterium sp.]|nr:S1 RNA-binding domain-containing protein [Parasporobacterium sp.]
MEEMMDTWEKLNKLMEENQTITVETNGFTTNGLVVYYEGIRGLIPASKIDVKRVENLEDYMNVVIDVKVIEADKKNNRLTFSARDVIVEKNRSKREQKIAEINIGDIFEGTVDSLKDFGAFVKNEDGISALLHVSQISSEKRVKSPEEVLKVGDRVKAVVTKNEGGKLSISVKQFEINAKKEAEAAEPDFVYEDGKEEASTSLGSLLADIKLD